MRFRDFHRNIKIRIIETFSSHFIGNMIFPFMTVYFAYHFGGKVTGFLLLFNVFLGMAVSLIGGYLSDQFGRRRMMLLAEYIRLLAFLIMALCNSPFFQSAGLTFAMTVLNSISWGLAGPASDAMLIDVSTPEQRKLMYSITYWSTNFSIAAGGILGALLFRHYLFVLFILLCFAELFVLVLVLFFINESGVPLARLGEKARPFHHILQLLAGYRKVMQDKLFVAFVTAGVLVFSMEQQLTNYIGIHLSDQMPVQQILFWHIDGLAMLGTLRSENTLIVVVLMLFVAKISRRVNGNVALIISCFLFSIGYGALSYFTNVWVLLIFMLVLTVGEVFRVPVEQSFAAAIPPENARSIYMAFNGLKYNAALLIASLTITISAYLSAFETSLLITAIGLTGTIIYYILLPSLNQKMQRDKQEPSSISE
ncbi:MDR family MFS transporter [Sporolactobacillus spathodeae]|uniref:DHA1 family multidrug resistance protein B-like MFS transporter n=1 Tax=Sporolactobacillus spathodeae TaxID=1465502 RepID=A0ABS2Q655_9BACL|nr:MFS transporter [Sporolactobacillus spathodeae]MBM7657086.1 DHA1 family multidrug resistance protein B-like MFS transporter [Sporolactobacillus spathodeae]